MNTAKGEKASYYRSLGMLYAGLMCALGVLFYSGVNIQTPILRAFVGSCVFLVVAILQYQMVTLMHEGLHQYLMPRLAWSSRITLCLNFYPIGATRSYRDIHMAHHRFFGEGHLDPDIHLYRHFPDSKLQFMLVLSSYFLGCSAFRRLLLISEHHFSRKEHLDIAGMVLTQLAIFALFSYIFSPFYYVLFWLLPLTTFAKGLNDLRTFAEHNSPSGRPTLRSFASNDIVTRIIGAFGFRFHAEHHIFPMIPYGRLGHVDATRGYATVEVFPGNYFQLLYHWFCSLPLTPTRASVKA